jgi:surface antigen
MVGLVLFPAAQARAVGWCGGVQDSCQCGADNPYPCCDNGNGKSSNCTWGAWHHGCCDWGAGLPPPWQHAKYWAGNYAPHPDYDVWGSPVAGSIGCKASGSYGHVAWVTGVNGGSVSVHEQSCCEGSGCWPGCSWCINGFVNGSYNSGYFDGGYIIKIGTVNKCGDGGCNNGENCSSCPQDCGACEWCGDGKCNNGENCSSCSQDCGACEWCGDGKCNNNENCSTCAGDCGSCCPNGACDYGENCSTCSQDCGGCCPNGACDFGEDCASCPQDCGICNDPPIGELQVVTCGLIAGWARDTDVASPIGVRILANGVLLHEMVANEANDTVPGFGFSFKVPADIKDGAEQAIEVIGEDDKDLADMAISGSGKKLLCRNGSQQAGIWTVGYFDAAGVDIEPAAGDPGFGGGMRLWHAGGLPYANSGVVTAFTNLGATPFEKVTLQQCGGFANPLYAAAAAIEGQTLGALGAEVLQCDPVEFVMPGQKIELTLAATSMVPDPDGRELVLKDLAAFSRGWKMTYSHDASGLLWGNQRVDQVSFASRSGATTCVGRADASRQFSKTFHGMQVSLAGSSASGPVPSVRVGDKTVSLADCPENGPCKLMDLEGDTLAVGLDCGAGSTIDGTWWKAADNMRVFGHFDMNAPPWTVTGQTTWGLSAVVPDTGIPGLAIRLTTEANDFFPYGKLAATAPFALPEFDRVMGMLSYSLPNDCYLGGIHVGGKPAKALLPGKGEGQIDIAKTGSQLDIMLTLAEECPATEDLAFVELTNASLRRSGWWSTPTPAFAGIRDLRGEGCSVGFENQKWWGNSGNAAYGRLLVHRFFADTYTGVRYSVKHDFQSEFFKLSMLVGGDATREHSLLAPADTSEEVTGLSFTELGFLFAVEMPGVYPEQWEASLSGIEVQAADGSWVSACTAAEGEPKLAGVSSTPVPLEDVVSTPDGGMMVEGGGDACGGGGSSGSCSAAGAGPGGGAAGAAALVMALLILAACGTRSRAPGTTNR